MSFSAVFTFDGDSTPKGHDVITCDVVFYQSTDNVGRPSSSVEGGYVVVMLTNMVNPTLTDWMLDSYQQKAWASIKFMRLDQESVMKQYDLQDVYLTHHSERKTRSGGSHIMLTLSPRKITVGSVKYEKNWAA